MLASGLDGRVCLVTGAASGIGLECARILAGENASLALCDIDEAQLKGGQVSFVADALLEVADVSRREDVERLIAATLGRFGRLDVLIHCAGIYRIAPLPEVTDAEWDAVLDVNLRSGYLLAQAAVDAMRSHGDGRIVLFGSFAARTGGLRAGVPYAAAKAGVEGITRHVAQYAGPLGIRVNCVHPGFTETPMVSILDDTARAEAAQRTPLRRGGRPEEIAAMAVVLASDLASYVHGATLDVNGGMYMA
jgi:3-oxoacyl-[acyl-carrier protein] reductase